MLSILDMVAIKLPQIDKTATAVTEAVELFGLNVMTELERCFKARYRVLDGANKIVTRDPLPENETPDNVGDEAFYRQIERDIVSDLVAIQYTFSQIIKLSSAITPENFAKFIKKAKADDTEVEYAGIEPKNVPYLLGASDLMRRFKSDAERKAKTLGCVIDINDDLTYQAYLKNPEAFAPSVFMVVRSNC